MYSASPTGIFIGALEVISGSLKIFPLVTVAFPSAKTLMEIESAIESVKIIAKNLFIVKLLS